MTSRAVGPWSLDHVAGRGAMGEVHRAHHVDTGQIAAVKFVHPDRIGDSDAVGRFRDEAGIVAQLDHPNVVRVYDAGEADGRPWVAMEWVDGGTLADALPTDFDRWRDMALALLAGLAHAHSRRVTHLDVKPGNLLHGDFGSYKLADFGIARLGMGLEGQVMGSPPYMAPEQIRGQWGDVGPWTDLYAVGCLLWTAASGATLYRGTTREILRGHLSASLPFFAPRFDVPDGLEEVLRWLLAKSPEGRPLFAADAMAALRSLDTIDDAALPAGLTASATFQLTEDWTGSQAAVPPPEVTEPAEIRPPIPADWRPRVYRAERNALGLLALRRAPTVGRTAERDRLWAELLDAAAGSLRAITVVGPPGSGRNRLAIWLSTRAHELGVALSVWVDGDLRRALALRLGAIGKSVAEVDARLRRVLPDLPDQERDLAARALADPTLPADMQVHGLRAVLDGLATRRPVIVVLEAADRSTERAGFARTLLDARSWRSPPLLLVLTSSEPIEGTAPLLLDPLDEHAFRDFLDAWLSVHPNLREALYRSSGGWPGIALDRLRRTASRGVLEPSPLGYRLAPGASLESRRPLPDPISAGARVAGLLGPRVDLALWKQVSGAPDLADLEALVDAELGHWVTDASGQRRLLALRESVAEHLSADARPAEIRAAAQAVETEDPGAASTLWLRVGESERAARRRFDHSDRRYRAGDPAGAMAALESLPSEILETLPPDLAAKVLENRIVCRRTLGLFDEIEDLARAAVQRADREDWNPDDRGRVVLQLARELAHQRRADEALAALGVEDGVALVPDDPPACTLQADVYRFCGRLEAALAVARAGADACTPETPAEDRVFVHWSLALASRLSGDLDSARREGLAGVELASSVGFVVPEAVCRQELAATAFASGDPETALVHQRRAIALFRRAGNRTDGVVAELNRGLLLMARERFAEARTQIGELLNDPRIAPGDHGYQAAMQLRCVLAVRMRDRSELERALDALTDLVDRHGITGSGFDAQQRELAEELRATGWESAAGRALALIGPM